MEKTVNMYSIYSLLYKDIVFYIVYSNVLYINIKKPQYEWSLYIVHEAYGSSF